MGIFFSLGWGGEDDDLSQNRLKPAGFQITRFDSEVSRYQALDHKPAAAAAKNIINQQDTLTSRPADIELQGSDGLNNLEYKVLKSKAMPLFYHIVAEL